MREAGPGLHVKLPFADKVAGRVNLRVRQLDVEIETKTADDVFVRVSVAVEHYVLPEKVRDAFYALDDVTKQITSFVLDAVRSHVPRTRFENVFDKKEDIASALKVELARVMEPFGHGILAVLVTDVKPDAVVKKAMGRSSASRLLQVSPALAPYGHAHHNGDEKRVPGNGG